MTPHGLKGLEKQRSDHQGDQGTTLVIGQNTVQKHHGNQQAFEREAQTYQLLRDKGFQPIPRLLNTNPHTLQITLERLTPWAQAPSHMRTRDALKNVGEVLAQLHALHIPSDDPMPLSAAMDNRLQHAFRQLDEHPTLQAELQAYTCETSPGRLFANEERRWCHRDFRPQNWAFDKDTNHIRLIDWEHARPDAPAVDFGRLSRHLTTKETTHVCEGYKTHRSLPTKAQRKAATFLHMVQTFAWAYQHNHDDYWAEAAYIYAHPELWKLR